MIYLIYLLVILLVPLEAFHDWHRDFVVRKGAPFNKAENKRSKKYKYVMLGTIYFIAIWMIYSCGMYEYSWVLATHFVFRAVLFDYFCVFFTKKEFMK